MRTIQLSGGQADGVTASPSIQAAPEKLAGMRSRTAAIAARRASVIRVVLLKGVPWRAYHNAVSIQSALEM